MQQYRTQQTSGLSVSIVGLIVLLILMVLGYVLLTASVVSSDYKVSDLKKEIVKAEEKNTELHIERSRVSSLDYVLDKTDELSYTQIKDVTYLERPHSSPLAGL